MPGPERKAAAERKQYEAETERIRAEAYRAQTAATFNEARLKGDKEAAKKMGERLMQPIRSNVERFTRLQTGKQSSEDWAALAGIAKGNPDPQLAADIQAKQWTPRVQQFLNATISYEALKFIAETGDIPDGEIVDLSSPQMQEFSQAVALGRSILKTPVGAAITSLFNPKSWEEKTSILNAYAAHAVLSGMTAPSPYQPMGMNPAGADPMGGMTPSSGQPMEGGGEAPVGPPLDDVARGTDQPFATGDMTQRAIEARRRGEDVPPTDTQEFRAKMGGGTFLGFGAQNTPSARGRSRGIR